MRGTSRFILIETLSGSFGLAYPDPKGLRVFFTPEAPNAQLGAALLKAFSLCRWIDSVADREFFDWRRVEAAERAMTAHIKKAYRYRSGKQFMQAMGECTATLRDGLITMQLFRPIDGREWRATNPEENVVISELATDDRLGEAIRLAIERCRSQILPYQRDL